MNRIKELRKEINMTQSELAKKLNVAQNTISNWENESRDIDNESLVKLSEIFEVSTDYILCNTDIKKAPSDKPEVTDDDIQFALFGGKVDDETYEDVKRFAAFIKAKKEEQKKEKE